jgi:hypothetical protein
MLNTGTPQNPPPPLFADPPALRDAVPLSNTPPSARSAALTAPSRAAAVGAPRTTSK